MFWAADLGDVDTAVGVAETAWDHFGGLDALVNNAAIGKRKLVQTLTFAAGKLTTVDGKPATKRFIDTYNRWKDGFLTGTPSRIDPDYEPPIN